MSDSESDKLDTAVECFKSGMSLAESASRYGLTLPALEAEVERRAKAKRTERQNSNKSDFVYESAQMEDAVNSVLCGMSIKDAANAYGVSKNALKQALRQELDKEPLEEGGLIVADEPTEDETAALFADSPLPEPAVLDTSNPRPQNVVVIEPTAYAPRARGEPSKLSVTSAEELGDEIPVHCGDFQGTLHRHRFMCPGLRSECIKLPDGRWVTPKTFSIIGGKASLKNWKNAVRIHNVSLRHYMDAGYLDFWEHETNCSGKCSHKSGGSLGKYQSRINSMRMKTAQEMITHTELHRSIDGANSPQSLAVDNKSILKKHLIATPTTTTSSSTLATETTTSETPALLPFMENVASSPAFTVLRQAQGRSPQGNQPVFPGPSPSLPQDGDDVTVTGMSPATRSSASASRAFSLMPSNINEISQQIRKAVGNVTSQSVASDLSRSQGTKATINGVLAPQTIIVRPIRQGDGGPTPSAKPVTYLVPSGLAGSTGAGAPRFQLGPNTVMIPVTNPALSQAVTQQHSAQLNPANIPDIANIMRDSEHFWKGIIDFGLLEQIVHDMKVQLSCIKRRTLAANGVIRPEDAKALSKVSSALSLQENIRYKLSEKQNDMRIQNDKIQDEINELQKKMEAQQKRQLELKRKAERFDELVTKRACVQLDSSDEEEEPADVTWPDAATPIDVVEGAAVSDDGLVIDNAPDATSTATSSPVPSPRPEGDEHIGEDATERVNGDAEVVEKGKSVDKDRADTPQEDNIAKETTSAAVKTGRKSRKRFVPVKKPVTPLPDDGSSEDEQGYQEEPMDYGNENENLDLASDMAVQEKKEYSNKLDNGFHKDVNEDNVGNYETKNDATGNDIDKQMESESPSKNSPSKRFTRSTSNTALSHKD